LQWLFEAKKRLGTSILSYAVTSNHIHLVIKDDKVEEVIPQTMQLIAGRIGQDIIGEKSAGMIYRILSRLA
jgi:putative transposase